MTNVPKKDSVYFGRNIPKKQELNSIAIKELDEDLYRGCPEPVQIGGWASR